jgi:hypothetical protein
MAIYNVPTDIGEMVDRVMVTATRLEPFSSIKDFLSRQALTEEPIKTTEVIAVMPLPNTITDSYQHTWNVTAGVTEEIEALAHSVMSSLPWNQISKHAAREGFTFNPYHQQTYEGTAPRDFSMEWVFIPRNPAEANQIRDMIRDFKKASAASRAIAGLGINSPCIWSLDFGPTLNDMLRFKELVAVDVSVNYTGGGYADFFHDNHPKQINLAISFLEYKPMFKEDWE